jgi:hypothetical protein
MEDHRLRELDMLLAAGAIVLLVILAFFGRGHRVGIRTGDDGRPQLRHHRISRYEHTRLIRRRGQVAPRARRHDPTPWCAGFCDDDDHPRPRSFRDHTGTVRRNPRHEAAVSGRRVTADRRPGILLLVIVLAGLFFLALYLHLI